MYFVEKTINLSYTQNTILNLSPHASIRQQQRGLPTPVLELLLEYGIETHDHHGGLIHHFTKKSLRLIEKLNSELYKLCSNFKNAYIVEKDGHIVTVGHRYKKIKNNP